jgi:acetyltransferase-like isoleucine patch superfamily enzyme
MLTVMRGKVKVGEGVVVAVGVIVGESVADGRMVWVGQAV